MQKIELTQGKYAIVDNDDFGRLSFNSWCLADSGYAKRGTKSNGKTTIHYMHRQITGAKIGEYVDHINGDKLDNRIENLELRTGNHGPNQSIKDLIESATKTLQQYDPERLHDSFRLS